MFPRISKNRAYFYELFCLQPETLKASDQEFLINLKEKIIGFVNQYDNQERGQNLWFALVGFAPTGEIWIAVGIAVQLVAGEKKEQLRFFEKAFQNEEIFQFDGYTAVRFSQWVAVNTEKSLPRTEGLRPLHVFQVENTKLQLKTGKRIRKKEGLVKLFFHFISCNEDKFLVYNTSVCQVLATVVFLIRGMKENEITTERSVEDGNKEITIEKNTAGIPNEIKNEEVVRIPLRDLTDEQWTFLKNDYTKYVRRREN